MRDVVVIGIILGSLPLCFFRPYFGLLMWTWIAYFNPHRLTYGFAYNFPVAIAVAVPTLAGLVFNRDRNKVSQIFTRETLLLLALWAWFGVAMWYASHQLIFAAHIAPGKIILNKISKILLMTMVAVLLVNTQKKLKYLCYVIMFSLSFYATKGAFFGIRTGAVSRVWGPPGSFIEDNNFLAVAINMTLPLLFFMARSETNRKLKLLLRFLFVAGIASVLLSYSRGGLLGLSVVLAILTFKSRHKVLATVLVVAAALLVLSFAPPAWMTRMTSFAHGQLDTSAEGRLNAWQFAWVLAQNYPLTGGGFETFTPDLFERFTPQLTFAGPHSIYFQMLGEQGFVGLGLFLLLLASCFLTYRQLRRRGRTVPELAWMGAYAEMFQVSLAAYMVSGAFLAMGYFDYFWQIVAMTAVLRILYRREMAAVREAQERPPVFVNVAEEAPVS